VTAEPEGTDPAQDRPTFPFSAVVGQSDLSLALLLSTVDPAIGGVLLRGQKGSGKTTLARGLAALLPEGGPFVELPVGTSEDRLIGSIDLRAALAGGERRFSPGLFHSAHGGVLYVDEVNLLPDHLVDVLLDVAASGVNRVEREGVSHHHPSRFVLVGSMNPEEGELRPQLLDRFGLSVDVVASTDPDERAEAVERRLAFDRDPVGFAAEWQEHEQQLRSRLELARPASVPHQLVRQVAHLCAAAGAEGLRADLVLCRAAGALAGWEGRSEATEEDVRRVAALALSHRRRRSPFEAPGMADDELQSMLDEAFDDAGSIGGPEGTGDGPDAGEPEGDSEGGGPECGSNGGESDGGYPGGQSEAGGSEGGPTEGGPAEGGPGRGESEGGPDRGESDDRLVSPGSPGAGLPLLVERPGASRRADPVASASAAPGRRAVVTGGRGRLVGDRVPEPGAPMGSVAVGATITAAAARHPEGTPGPVEVGEVDLREAVRQQRTANLVVLAVDASGSMHADGRMAAAKGAVLGLLVDAYQRRDRVALVTFRDTTAEVVLRPTGSTEVAEARLAELPTGGRTPLAEGIATALRVATTSKDGAWRPLLVVVSDGRATAAPEGVDPVSAAMEAAESVRRQGVSAVVVDAEGAEGTDGRSAGVRLGLARQLAETMGARYLTVAELTAETIVGAVRGSLPTH
jgi:magnesium chelatase subunit D